MGQFAKLVSNTQNLTVSQQQKVFLSERYTPGATRPEEQATTAAAIVLGDEDITLAAGLSVDLWEGTPLLVKADFSAVEFGEDYFSTYVIVSQFTAAGETTIPIEPALIAVTTGADVKIPAWIPFFSCKTAAISSSSNIISDNVFSGGLDMEKAETSIDSTANTSGPIVYGDPGLEECRLAQKEGKVLFVMSVKPFQRGGRAFDGYISQFDDNADKDQFEQSTVNFAVTGEVIKMAGLAATGL